MKTAIAQYWYFMPTMMIMQYQFMHISWTTFTAQTVTQLTIGILRCVIVVLFLHSCRDELINNPPVNLIQDYFKCRKRVMLKIACKLLKFNIVFMQRIQKIDIFNDALGIAYGNAFFFTPLIMMLFLPVVYIFLVYLYLTYLLIVKRFINRHGLCERLQLPWNMIMTR